MRKSLGHCLLIAVVAIVFSSVGSGCKSGGWSMPGASWVSWGKKKPPTSSIAGTRDPLQPPSISVPPYPPDDSSSESSTALASYPSTGSGSAKTSSPTSGTANAADTGTRPGFDAVGPYATSSSSASPTQQTQQGFYYQNTPPSETATADARNGYGAPLQPGYGAEQPNSTYAPPTGYGSTAPPTSYGSTAPPTTGYGSPVPPTGYGATTPYAGPNEYAAGSASPADYANLPTGAADAAYPPSPAGAYPAPAAGTYPTTDYASTYPSTNAPYGPGTTPAPSPYGSTQGGTPLPVAPAGYGPEPAAVYSASSQNSAYGAPTGTGPATGSAYDTSSQYRPGSTGRNANLLSPSGGTRMATPTGSSTYPNTYYNR